MVLLMGDRDDDPLFLQVKEADTSVLAPYAGAGEYEQQGERVVQGQRVMQAASDPFLGWATGTGARGREFYVRQLRDMKGSAVIETMPPARLARYGELCGVTLARAHARSGDAAKIAGYLGDDDTFDRALEHFAVAYADQNDADYAEFTRRRGRAAHRGRSAACSARGPPSPHLQERLRRPIEPAGAGSASARRLRGRRRTRPTVAAGRVSVPSLRGMARRRMTTGRVRGGAVVLWHGTPE